MKNLFFKEIKLAFHPIIWVFMFVFPFMILIPNYPLYIGLIYVCSCYPILFLGANKGVQSNDLTYTCLLPIKKSDAIKARMLTVAFIQLVVMLLMGALSPLAYLISESIKANSTNPEELMDVGFGVKGILCVFAGSLVSFSIYDMIFFNSFYRNGRSIILGTLLGIFAFMTVDAILTLFIPLALPNLKATIEDTWYIQIIILFVSIAIYVVLHILTFKASSKKLEKVDL